MPPSGVTPGMRRPVRTITLPSIPSRISRFGLPTSSAPSGVIVAALIPRPGLDHRRRGLLADAVLGRAAILEREVEALQLDVEPDHVRVEHPQRLLEQLLAGLVALEHDYPQPGHGREPRSTSGPRPAPGAGPRWRPTTAFAPTSRPASAARSSAAWSTSSPGRSATPTGRPGELTEPSGIDEMPAPLLALRRRAGRGARPPGPPPRRVSRRRRLLLGRPHGAVGQGGRQLGLNFRSLRNPMFTGS